MTQTTSAATNDDLIMAEVVRGALAAVAEEIGSAVVRGAYSSSTKESGDVSGAIFDATGRLVAQSANTLFAHVASLRACIRSVLEDYSVDEMGERDLIFMNDPYRGGVHSNDIAVFRPLHVDGRVAFFTGTLVHVADLGGIAPGGVPGNATDQFQEGLVIPPVFLARGGELVPSVLKIIGANSRIPHVALGDLKALVGGANMGAKRLEELIARFGFERLCWATDFLIDYAERRTRMSVSRLPSGTFTGEGTIDDDGIERDRSLHVRVAVTSQPDGTLLVDFTGTDAQGSGPVNASYSQATSAAVYGSRVFVDDPDIPVNEGVFNAVQLVLPKGTLVSPNWPAACNARGIVMMAIIEAMFEALSKQQPERAVAGSPVNHVMSPSTHDPSTGSYRMYRDSDYGGLGARSIKDGVDACGAAFLAGRPFTVSVEGAENEHPVMYDSYRLRVDSAGPGRRRGGLGTERTIRFLTDGLISMRSDKAKFPPKGFAGGGQGAPAGWVHNRGRDDEVVLSSKETNVKMRPGDTLTMLTAGGGGYGHPMEREPELVLTDVLEGRVSVEAALRDYGVVISPETMTVDTEATNEARRSAGRQEAE